MQTYQDLLKQCRDEATDLMVQNAEKLQANAILNVRLQNSSIEEGAAEVLAIGTAVRFVQNKQSINQL